MCVGTALRLLHRALLLYCSTSVAVAHNTHNKWTARRINGRPNGIKTQKHMLIITHRFEHTFARTRNRFVRSVG